MILVRGGIARGKPLPGDLCVCIKDRVIYRAAVPACKSKPLPCEQYSLLVYISRTGRGQTSGHA